MAQVLTQGVLEGGNGQVTAWGPLAASAGLRCGGGQGLLGFCLPELSAPGPRCLLNPNEAAGSPHCSALRKSRTAPASAAHTRSPGRHRRPQTPTRCTRRRSLTLAHTPAHQQHTSSCICSLTHTPAPPCTSLHTRTRVPHTARHTQVHVQMLLSHTCARTHQIMHPNARRNINMLGAHGMNMHVPAHAHSWTFVSRTHDDVNTD